MTLLELHRETWAHLQRRRAQLPHALLFHGQRGLGKYDLALAFAQSLLCEKLDEGGAACGQCLPCKWFLQGNHPDFRLLRPESESEAGQAEAEADGRKPSQQIRIEQIRALEEFLHVGTHRDGARVVLLEPAEAMNSHTANALLKTLEEPAPGTVFLLVSSAGDRLLPTIRSRCQGVAVPPPPADRAAAWLAQAGVTDGARWLALAGGAPGLARELAGQAGEAGASLLSLLQPHLLHGEGIDPGAAAAALEKGLKGVKPVRGGGLFALVEWLQKWCFDLGCVANGLPPRYFVSQETALARCATRLDMRKLLGFNREVLDFKAVSEHTLNPRLFLEDLLMRYVSVFDRDASARSVSRGLHG